jgi:hypothetical protein
MGYGWHPGGGFWLGPLLFLVLVGVVVFLVSRAVTLHGLNRAPVAPATGPVATPPVAPPPPARPEPLDILRERFARGDITLDDFETAKRALGYPSSATPPPGAPPAA